MKAIAAAVLVVALAAVAHADQISLRTAADVVSRIAVRYGRAQGVSASYTYEAHDSKRGSLTEYSGRVFESRAGTYRFELTGPGGLAAEIIFDGTSSWRIDHEHRRYRKAPPKPVLAAALAFAVPGDLAANYTPKLRRAVVTGAETAIDLTLTPTQASGRTARLDLTLSEQGTVHAVTVTEISGSTYAFHFTAQVLDAAPATDASTYTVTPSMLQGYAGP